jgi:hypothetical protein
MRKADITCRINFEGMFVAYVSPHYISHVASCVTLLPNRNKNTNNAALEPHEIGDHILRGTSTATHSEV